MLYVSLWHLLVLLDTVLLISVSRVHVFCGQSVVRRGQAGWLDWSHFHVLWLVDDWLV